MIAALALAAQVALAPCVVEGVSGDVQCGVHRVWEDRDAKKGRQIDLSMIVLRATESPREPDALFVLAGGPGQSTSINAAFFGRTFAEVRRHRDIVLLDLRGTGHSHPLTCPEIAELPPTGVFDANFLPPDAIARCRTRLEKQADLRLYTTEIAVTDLDEVRAALGYEQINLYGTSYGTRAALIYVRDFERHVRTVTMKGVVPHTLISPTTHAADGERAWKALVARCAADSACQAAYPALDAEFRAVLQRLDRSPVIVEAKRPDGTAVKVTLTRGLFGEAFRNLLYSPSSAARAPAMVAALAKEDYSVIAPIALQTRMLASGDELSAGFFLSVSCAEDVPFIPLARAATLTAGTFGGSYRIEQQRQACHRWVRGAVRQRGAPVRSAIPVLMFSGDQDPVTPAASAEEVLKYLPNGRHIIVANNGHAFGSLQGCGEPLIAQFIQARSASGLDTSCASSIPAIPFFVEKRP